MWAEADPGPAELPGSCSRAGMNVPLLGSQGARSAPRSAPHTRSSELEHPNPGQDTQTNPSPVRGGVRKEIHILNSKINWFLSGAKEWDQRFLQYQFKDFFSCHNESGIRLCSMTENQVLKARGSYAGTEFLKDWGFFRGEGRI